MTADDAKHTLIVKEARGINLFLLILFAGMFAAALYGLTLDDSKAPADYRYFKYVSLLSIGVVVYFARKLFIRKALLQIDKNGIRYNDKHITDWQHLVSAEWVETDSTMGIGLTDMLVLQYYPTQSKELQIIELPVSHTATFNESDIMPAIEYWANKPSERTA